MEPVLYVSKPSHTKGNSLVVLIIFLCLLMFLAACPLISLIYPRLSTILLNMTIVWLLYVDCRPTWWPYVMGLSCSACGRGLCRL